jgi:hypothetical protein
MLKIFQTVHPLFLLVIATLLEVSGDAVVRMGIYQHAGATRIALFLAGAALLFGYGSFLNLAPIEFGRVVGLYIATHPGRRRHGDRGRGDHHLLETRLAMSTP